MNGVHGAPCVFVSRDTSLWGRGGDASMSTRSTVAGIDGEGKSRVLDREVARIEPASTCVTIVDWRARKGVGAAIRVLRRCPTGEKGSL